MAHRGSRGIALLFLDHGTRRGEESASRPGHSLPPGKSRYPLCTLTKYPDTNYKWRVLLCAGESVTNSAPLIKMRGVLEVPGVCDVLDRTATHLLTSPVKWTTLHIRSCLVVHTLRSSKLGQPLTFWRRNYFF